MHPKYLFYLENRSTGFNFWYHIHAFTHCEGRGPDLHQRPSKLPHTKQLVKNQNSSEDQTTSNMCSATITSAETLQEATKKLNCTVFLVLSWHPAVTEQPYFLLWGKLHMLACTQNRQLGQTDMEIFLFINHWILALASWRQYWSGQSQNKNKQHQTVINSSKYTTV